MSFRKTPLRLLHSALFNCQLHAMLGNASLRTSGWLRHCGSVNFGIAESASGTSERCKLLKLQNETFTTFIRICPSSPGSVDKAYEPVAGGAPNNWPISCLKFPLLKSGH